MSFMVLMVVMAVCGPAQELCGRAWQRLGPGEDRAAIDNKVVVRKIGRLRRFNGILLKLSFEMVVVMLMAVVEGGRVSC